MKRTPRRGGLDAVFDFHASGLIQQPGYPRLVPQIQLPKRSDKAFHRSIPIYSTCVVQLRPGEDLLADLGLPGGHGVGARLEGDLAAFPDPAQVFVGDRYGRGGSPVSATHPPRRGPR